MGIYKKIGIRKIAIYILDLITWTRNYGLKDGLSIFYSLTSKKNNFYKISTTFFKSPVWLRDNYSDKAIFKQVFYEKQYNLDYTTEIKAKRIIDAGANIGCASIYFSNSFPDAEIIAIEPDSNNFDLLLKNTANYPQIKCLKAAVWSHQEMVSITNPDSLAASFIIEKKDNSTIQGITLDQILFENQWNEVDIVKLDIEGAEREVFSGKNEWMKKTKLLIIELHDRYKPDCTKTFFRALEPYNYNAYFQHENIFIHFNND